MLISILVLNFTHPIHQSYQQNLLCSQHVRDSLSPWLAEKIWWSVIAKCTFCIHGQQINKLLLRDSYLPVLELEFRNCF